MLNNKLNIIIASLIISVGLIVFALSNRFYIDTSTHFKVDRLTGKTYSYHKGEWQEIKNKPITHTTDTSDNKSQDNVPDDDKDNVAQYLKNIQLLRNNENIYNQYIEYYNGIMKEYDKNPLFYKQSDFTEYSVQYFRTFQNYSPYLSEKYVADIRTDLEISTPDEFLDLIEDYYLRKLEEN